MAVFGTFEIEVTDFKEDPSVGAAFEIMFDVRGPGNFYELVFVLFEEDFMINYFKIPWHKDLPKEEKKLVHEKRDLFIKWAVMKVEEKIKKKLPEEKLFISYEKDSIWAEKVEKDILKQASEKSGEHLFILKL